MTFEVRKPLLAQMLDVFEPGRSKRPNKLNYKDLTVAMRIGNTLQTAKEINSWPEAISTFRGKW